MTPIIVTFPVYNRPELLKRVLESWSKVRGVEGVIMEFHCEPSNSGCAALCDAVDFCEKTVWRNPTRLGHALNVLASMNTAFQRTDYAIQALDDFVVSTDILELHDWHRAAYQHDGSVLAMTSGRDVPALPVRRLLKEGRDDDLAAVWRCQLIGANSGFHRHKWEALAARWSEGAANWWGWVNMEWLQSGPGLDVLFPALSRADDIGDYHPSSCFVPDPPQQPYYEVKRARERASGFNRYLEVYGSADRGRLDITD